MKGMFIMVTTVNDDNGYKADYHGEYFMLSKENIKHLITHGCKLNFCIKDEQADYLCQVHHDEYETMKKIYDEYLMPLMTLKELKYAE